MKIKWPLHLFTTKGLNTLILEKQKEAVIRNREAIDTEMTKLLASKVGMRRLTQKSKDFRKRLREARRSIPDNTAKIPDCSQSPLIAGLEKPAQA